MLDTSRARLASALTSPGFQWRRSSGSWTHSCTPTTPSATGAKKPLRIGSAAGSKSGVPLGRPSKFNSTPEGNGRAGVARSCSTTESSFGSPCRLSSTASSPAQKAASAPAALPLSCSSTDCARIVSRFPSASRAGAALCRCSSSVGSCNLTLRRVTALDVVDDFRRGVMG
eukprot:7386065-Prymnesium_polylepis.2